MNRKSKILLVDDEKDICTLIKDSLCKYYHVTTAHDGVFAMDILKISSFDLLLLDVMMPRINGFEVARTLKEQGVHVPIVFISALNAPSSWSRAILLGAEDFIFKPFSINDLKSKIHNVLIRTR